VSSRLQIHLVTDPRLPEARLLAAIDAAVYGGVDVVQVRDKVATDTALVRLARAVRGLVAGRALVIVNGPVALARKSGASGVHLPEGHPDLPGARAALGPDAYIGVSAHSVAAAVAAERAGASSVTFGNVYATPSHPGAPGRGLAALRAVVAAVGIPVIAIGGIDASRVPDVLETGAAGVAVISAILGADDPRLAAEALRAGR
jgi:thiamine-phosphate pyrophosphorylase